MTRTRLHETHPWWMGVDAVAVVIFVGIGRSVHDHGVSLGGLASTSWPFLTGLAVGWWFLLRRKWNGASRRAGVVAALSTVAVGMALRVVAGQGTAAAFVIVAAAFLGLFMVGPRELGVRRRSLRVRRPAPED